MNEDLKMRKYLASVERKLNMPKAVRTRVMSDLISSIQGRREAGHSHSDIFAELGTPRLVAADLNEQMKDYTYVKSPWRWVCFVIAIGSCLSLLFGGAIGLLEWLMNVAINNSIGIIGGADGPTAIFITASDDFIWYQIGISALVLVMSAVGYYRLRRCPRS